MTPLQTPAIVAAGILVADSEGFGALTMRRVAKELNAGAMSLYRHVANRDDLIAAMTAEVFSQSPYPATIPADWREAMRVAAAADYQVFSAHPWAVLSANVPRFLADSGCFSWMQRALAPLSNDPAVQRISAMTMWAYVQGSMAAALSRLVLTNGDAAAEHSAPPEWVFSREDFDRGLDIVIDGIAARVFHNP